MPSGWYNRGLYELAVADTDLNASTIKAMLLKSSYAFDRDDAVVSDVSAHEVTVAGYTRQTMSGLVVSQNDTNDAAYWDASDPSWGPLTAGETVRFVVLFRDTGADATSPLLCCWQVVDKDTDGSLFVFQIATLGLTKVWSAT